MKNNCTRLMKKITLSVLCLAFVACSNKSSDAPAAASPNTLATESSAEASNEMAASGAMRSESKVTGHEFSAGESSSGGGSMTLEQILAAYPVLASRASFLASIDRAVETDAGTWDLYANGAVVMTLRNNGSGGLSVVSAAGGFAADAIHLKSGSGDQTQGKGSSGIHFVMSSCKPDDKTPAQEDDKTPKQEQDKTPAQEDDKTPKQEQDKTPAQEDDKTPKQEQDKTPEQDKVEECASIEGTLWLEEVPQKQEQEQDKTPAQEDDKTPKQEQDKYPAQEDDKTPKQEQDKTQDRQDQLCLTARQGADWPQGRRRS